MGLFVFAGAQDNSIQRFELATGKITSLTGHESWVRALAFVQGGEQLVSGDYLGRLIWWNTQDDKPVPVRTIEAHDGGLRALKVSPDGSTIASCGNDRKIKLWSAVDGKLLSELSGHGSDVHNVAFHSDGKQLASCDNHGVVKHWDLGKGTSARDLDAGVLYKFDPNFRAHIGGARAMTFNASGTQLACAGITNVTNAFNLVGNPLVVVFDWASGKLVRQLAPQEVAKGTMWGVVSHPAGFWAVVVGASLNEVTRGKLLFWKADLAVAFHTVKLPEHARDLDAHPDGCRLAIAHADGAVRIFDMSPKQWQSPAGTSWQAETESLRRYNSGKGRQKSAPVTCPAFAAI